MIKYITSLFILFLLTQSFLFSSNSEYDKFDYIRRYDSGRYVVIAKSGNRYGVIDLFGEEIINPKYKYISYSQDSLFLVRTDSLYCLFDMNG